MTGGCHFSNLLHVCGDNFHALRSPGVSGVEMKIYERWLQALLSSAPCSRVLARLALLAQIGELGRRLSQTSFLEFLIAQVNIKWPWISNIFKGKRNVPSLRGLPFVQLF